MVDPSETWNFTAASFKKGPILEPTVGNGRILISLLEADLAIEGFDALEEIGARYKIRRALGVGEHGEAFDKDYIELEM